MSTAAPAFTRSGPSRRLQLESLPVERLRGLVIATVLVATTGAVLAVNLTGAPLRQAGEGTIVSRAWAVENLGRLAPTTYLYDQPPLGWLQVSAWARLTDAFDRAPTAVAAGREAMVIAFLASASLLWVLARRLGLARWSSAVALAAFGLSPLAIALHRQVSYENLAMPWLLAAFVLAAGPRRRLGALAASGALLGMAALTSPDVLLLLPALALALWQATGRENRRYVLAVATAAFVAVGAAWVALAALRVQLLTGDGPSLAQGVEDQLLDLARTGNVLSSGTTGNGIVSDWLALDPVLPALGLAGAVLALVRLPRLAPTAVGLLVVVAAVVRPGHLTPSLAALLLPMAALLVGGVTEHLWPRPAPGIAQAHAGAAARPTRAGAVDDPAARATGPGPVRAAGAGGRGGARRGTTGRAGVGVAAGVATLAVAAVATAWAPDARRLLSDDEEAVPRAAARWVADNVDDGPIMVDAALWTDLAEAGVPTHRLVLHPSFDDTPRARDTAVALWPGAGAVVSGPASRAGATTDERLGAFLDGSLVVATFGAGSTEVEVRAVDPEATDVADLRRHDPARAIELGGSLARNPDLTFGPEARALLVEGRVDERVMTTLVAIGGTQPIQVADFPADPAEVAAGEARRSVLLRTDDPAGAADVARLLDRQDEPDRPADVSVAADGWVRVTWALAALS